MEAELSNIISQVQQKIFTIAIALIPLVGGARLIFTGLRQIAQDGEDKSDVKAMRQVAKGILIIFLAPTILYFITAFARSISVIKLQ